MNADMGIFCYTIAQEISHVLLGKFFFNLKLIMWDHLRIDTEWTATFLFNIQKDTTQTQTHRS